MHDLNADGGLCLAALSMYSPIMIPHVVHTTEGSGACSPVATLPRTLDGRVVLGFMAGPIFAGCETPGTSIAWVVCGLRALLVPTKKSFEVLAIMASKIAPGGEHSSGFAVFEGALTGPCECGLGDVVV